MSTTVYRTTRHISSSITSMGGSGGSSMGGGISAIAWGSIGGTLSLQTDLQDILNNKLFTSDLLSTILTIDGTGSGIDADLLDGHHGSYFLSTTGTAYDSDRLGGSLANLYAKLASPTFTGQVTDNTNFYISQYNGIAQFIGNWPASNYWGIGSVADTNKVKIESCNIAGTFAGGDVYLSLTGRLGIGTAPTRPLTILGDSTSNSWENTILAYDSRTLAAGVGGGITFGGIYTNIGNLTEGGFVKIEKQIATSGYTGFDLILGSRIHGTPGPTEGVRLHDGSVGMGGVLSPTSSLEVGGTGIKSETIQSQTVYYSGFFGDGYKIIETGGVTTAEFDNLIVRKTLRAYTLEIDKIDVVGGSLVVSPASGTVVGIEDHTTYWQLYFDTNHGANPIQFQDGDYIAAQEWKAYDHTIIQSYRGHIPTGGVHQYGDSEYIHADIVYGSNPPWVGMKLTQLGNSTNSARQNLLYLTSSDTNNPYIEAHTGVTAGVFTDSTRKFRLGNLAGITDATLSPSGYGLYSQNCFLSGKIIASSGLIGGWTINSDYLVKDTGIEATSCGMVPTEYPFFAGATYINRINAPTQITNTGLIISKLFAFKYLGVGETVMFSSDNENMTDSDIYIQLKTKTFGDKIQGTKEVRIKFDLKISTPVDTAYAQVYRNGSPVGAEKSTNSTTYVNFSQDIAGWAANDTVELWVHSGTGYMAFVQHFQICGEHITGFINEVGDNS
jgi:hypothetical protein